jgi:hypothetical protein
MMESCDAVSVDRLSARLVERLRPEGMVVSTFAALSSGLICLRVKRVNATKCHH